MRELPEHDFLYLGDNARAPYGTRSFEAIYEYTLECVQYLFAKGCHLVILACNTASAKALRNIQILDLPRLDPHKRVLGVIRPTTEVIGQFTKTNSIGILGTTGTVKSASYLMEINRLWPALQVFQQACPMWVPLVENGELAGEGAIYFIKKYLDSLLEKAEDIDVVLLACTHYPLLLPLIRNHLPKNIKIISQGGIAARSLKDYLRRHPEIDRHCGRSGQLVFQTTGDMADFDGHASMFFGKKIKSHKVHL